MLLPLGSKAVLECHSFNITDTQTRKDSALRRQSFENDEVLKILHRISFEGGLLNPASNVLPKNGLSRVGLCGSR